MNDDLIKQIEELYLPNVMDDINAVIYQVESLQKKVRDLTEERDKARRMYCEIDNCTRGESLIIAEDQGWDCFKENTQAMNNIAKLDEELGL
jgi:hypothetical protein